MKGDKKQKECEWKEKGEEEKEKRTRKRMIENVKKMGGNKGRK